MGLVIRQSIKSSLFNYVGIALGYVNMVWLYPSILDPDTFGLIRVLVSAAMLFAQFGEFGLSNTLIRFYPYFKDDLRAARGFIGFVLLIATGVSSLLIGAVILFKKSLFALAGGKEALLSENFHFVLIISISVLFSEILYALSRANFKSVFPSFVKETLLRLLQLLAIAAYSLGWLNLYEFLFAFSLSYFIGLLAIYSFLKINGILKAYWPKAISRVKPLKEIILFSFFVFLNKLPNRALNQIDVLMLGALAGLHSAGTYSIAFFIAEIVRIPARNIALISNPIIAEAWKNEDTEKIAKMYRQSSVNQLLIGGLFLILIVSNVNDLTSYLQDKYSGLYFVVALLGLAKVFDMATGVNGLIIANSKYYRYSLIFNVSLLALAILTNYLLIPVYGINGAAMATAFSVFLLNIIKTFFVKYKFDMQPFTPKAGLIVLVLIALFIMVNFLPLQFSPIINILFRTLLTGILFILSVYYLQLSVEIIKIMKELRKRMITFFKGRN